MVFKNQQFKDIDSKQGIIKGYASVFGNKDSDGDVIVKGAYTKTIKENADRIAFLYQHDIRKPIGKSLSLNEDAYGLAFEAQFSKSTLGRDVMTLAEEGIIKEVSVGFRTIKGESRKEFYEIQEVKLYEYSLVTLAANSQAVVTGMKAEEKADFLGKRLQELENYMRKGTVTDETFRLLEFEISNLNDIYKSLNAKPEPQPHSGSQEPTFDRDKFFNLLKS